MRTSCIVTKHCRLNWQLAKLLFVYSFPLFTATPRSIDYHPQFAQTMQPGLHSFLCPPAMLRTNPLYCRFSLWWLSAPRCFKSYILKLSKQRQRNDDAQSVDVSKTKKPETATSSTETFIEYDISMQHSYKIDNMPPDLDAVSDHSYIL